MSYLKGVQESLYQIKDLLKKNEDIGKLLLNDNKNALNEDPYPISEVEENIFNSAVFDVTEPPYNKNTIITIALTKMMPDEETVFAENWVRINIITRSNLWEINNDKIRPLEIANLIIKELENKKLKTSHKVVLGDMELIMLDHNINGYGLTFGLFEGVGLDEGF